ncbi:MAG: cytochrome C biogenesis protein [Campylobacteraceae bacterium 4484_166]|nr:MAG: cytochrome C biogenesis protein [Campylobacteraceae bacterium 4484_166]
MKKIYKFMFSYITTIILLSLLAIGAGVATILENDFGTSTARVLVYNNLWYEIVLVLSIINLIGVMINRKMYKNLNGRTIFHFSFVVILIGASMTRYIGYEGIMHIREGQSQSDMISLEPYIIATVSKDGKNYEAKFQKEFSAIGDNSFFYNIRYEDKVMTLSMSDYKFAKKGKDEMNLIGTNVTIGDETQNIKLVGKRGSPGITKELKFKSGEEVVLSYGSKMMSVPFAIKLNKFELDRYPGSQAPSSYASEVTVIDDKNIFDYRIYMNSTLKYGGYQFFQSSYDQDEKGTILSVNNDPGTIPTYIGYFLLTLGLLMNMFDKKSRFAKLTKYIKNSTAIFALVTIGLMIQPLHANDDDNRTRYFKTFKENSIKISKDFGRLVVQSSMGRMKPLNTLNIEIVQKLTKKSTFLGYDADQIVLGMLTRPEMWGDVKMITIKSPKLKEFLKLPKDRKYVAFNEVFDDGEYKLADESKKANAISPNQRGTYEKEILKIDEKLSIAFQVYQGNLFNLYAEDTNDTNNKWSNPLDAMKNFTGKNKEVVEQMTRGFISSVVDEDWSRAKQYIGFISMYQKKIGKDVMISDNMIDTEIFFNKLAIFPKLTIFYIFSGLILFTIAFVGIFRQKELPSKLITTLFITLCLFFAAHTFAMAGRWYISGHAPWSDTYESLIYIAWSAMFAGLFFFRKSIFSLSATVTMAGVFMFTAHLSGIDPQITNLVPVLKSYWLTIHVSIITGSYGFLAIGAMLGFTTMILFIIKDEKKPLIDKTIYQITAINEASLIIGLSMLVIGNFIGGVWANESWGRYWGWDPKETWAYVSIVVYILVLHLRFIKPLNNPYVFAVASTLAFASILMTYFGVNFYLSGMHSYATGDPVPIPTWVYLLSSLVLIVALIASRKRDLKPAL